MQNQSLDMKTVVETYLVEENLSLLYDNETLTKWNDQVAFLELEGQKTIVQEDKSPIPFLWMNEALVNVFKTLCPTEAPIEKYNKMPIPLEILELVALSKREGYFDSIKIWYDEKTPDPVCVGYKIPEEYKAKDSWYHTIYSEKYLIGKWSDAKASFAELTARAKERFIGERQNELHQQQKTISRELEDLEISANAKFGAKSNDANLLF